MNEQRTTEFDDDVLSAGDNGWLSLRIVWSDEYMIEVECTVHDASWSAVARGYTQCAVLSEFARDLKNFAKRCEGAAEFEAVGEGKVRLRFYPFNKAKHIACRVELSTHSDPQYSDYASTFSHVLHTETSFVDTFIGEIEDVATGLYKEAVLRLVRSDSN